MKNKILPLLFIILIAFIGCDLEREVVTGLQEQQIIENYEYAQRRATSTYEGLPSGFTRVGNAMLASAADDAEFTHESSSIQRFNTGNWNAINNPDDQWSSNYRAIFIVNRFLETVDGVNLDVWKLDPSPSAQESYQIRLKEIEDWKNEARFLRAFYYFELVKRYGGVPLITISIETTDDYSDVKRATLDECIKFIIDECDYAAGVLPELHTSGELGRATKGSALALKSRVLLYAASDLFNDASWAGDAANSGYIVSSNTDRIAKWKDAADAAKAVIDLNEYSLHSNYGALFQTFNSPEIILARRAGASNHFERINYPIGFDRGESGNTPSQNLVDSYEMNDGSKFDWNNPAHAMAPYENRDPRLAQTILANNTTFKGRPLEIWAGGRDGKGVPRAARTGYYLRKYVNPNLNLLQNQTSVHTWILIRLAEIYLNYAEALNESDPGNPDIKHYVDLVRARVNMPPLPDGLSQAEMRDRIRNERRVELAFEEHRFWDVRRWMKGAEYFGAPLRGVDITRVDEDVFDYQPVNVENRAWSDRMYLYPIPQSEILQMGWQQNPGW